MTPDRRYRDKLFLIAGLGYAIPAIGILIAALAIMAANGVGLSDRPGAIFLIVFALSSAVLWAFFIALIPPYFRSISYELTDTEIVVRKGIVTKVVKTVPYRTVTNIVKARDLLDRYAVNLGSINIQTAGKSGETGYEASLEGLGDWEEAHRMVLERLRGFRGAMKPTAAEVEDSGESENLLRHMLEELKAIRAAVERKD